MIKHLPAEDLEYILSSLSNVLTEFANKRIFITGGTGFFGNWLVSALCHANHTLNLNLSLTLLTRDKKSYFHKMPHLSSDACITLLEGDVRSFRFPIESHDFIIHAATETNAMKNAENPAQMQDVIVSGTKRVLDFAAYIHAKKMLYVSSGAVYQLESDNPSKVLYAMAKLQAEQLCIEHAAKYNTDIKIARCFAFVGPYLPLDQHFAVGNFINDAIHGKAIQLNSDGSSYRSYQYAADLVVWLLTILSKGNSCKAYNVGSDEAISILNLAKLVASQFNPALEVNVTQSAAASDHYIPDVSEVRKVFGFSSGINLTRALQKTIDWYKS